MNGKNVFMKLLAAVAVLAFLLLAACAPANEIQSDEGQALVEQGDAYGLHAGQRPEVRLRAAEPFRTAAVRPGQRAGSGCPSSRRVWPVSAPRGAQASGSPSTGTPCPGDGPAGRSAHLELGYMIGRGKPGFILLDGMDSRFDVMYQFATGVANNELELLAMLKDTFHGA